MHAAFEAAELMVIAAQRYHCMNGNDARKLVRAEISADTRDEIISGLRNDFSFPCGFTDFMQGKAPFVFRGVSFYCIYDLPVPWRVIGLGQTTGGRPTAAIVEGSAADAEVG